MTGKIIYIYIYFTKSKKQTLKFEDKNELNQV